MSKSATGERDPARLTGCLLYDAVTTIAILCVTEKSLATDCRAVMAVVIVSWLRVLFSHRKKRGSVSLSWNRRERERFNGNNG